MVSSFPESHHSRDPYHHAGQSTDYPELSPHASKYLLISLLWEQNQDDLGCKKGGNLKQDTEMDAPSHLHLDACFGQTEHLQSTGTKTRAVVRARTRTCSAGPKE